jgi:hypothetical protein
MSSKRHVNIIFFSSHPFKLQTSKSQSNNLFNTTSPVAGTNFILSVPNSGINLIFKFSTLEFPIFFNFKINLVSALNGISCGPVRTTLNIPSGCLIDKDLVNITALF